MKRPYPIATVVLLMLISIGAMAQSTLSLAECRRLAIENNKQLAAARLQKNIATSNRQAARTKYLPRVDAMAGYELMSKEISLLDNQQKTALNTLGTRAVPAISGDLNQLVTNLVQQGLITPEVAGQLGQQLAGMSSSLAAMGDELGSTIRKAFRTNNRNMFAGSVMINQPLYMGGSITALNRMAEIGEDMADNSYEVVRQNLLYEIETAYWMVVSLKQKERLADSYINLVKTLSHDVQKMIDEGVATRADGLSVEVRMNEAEMSKMRVEDNLTLARMLLCQLCGLPMDRPVTLADENADLKTDPSDGIAITPTTERAELRMLQNAIDLSEQSKKLITAAYYRPQIALTGGYLISNPNLYNGFKHKFSGIWNVGVLVRMPIWNWKEGRYKLNAAKTATRIAEMERMDMSEKINLQTEQHRFKVLEAQRRLELARKHVASADENLRCANLGFREGVMSLTELTSAHTAWETAHTQEIDAQIEIKLSQAGLKKALGQLE